jgi:predicted nucleic acid-binding protein
MKLSYLDANILVRFITNEPPEMAERCVPLFQKLENGEIELVTNCLVIAEVIWVLESFYRYSAPEIAPQIRVLIDAPHLHIDGKDVLREALSLYELKGVGFTDALVAARMQRKGISEIYSWDKHFDRFSHITRMEP